MALRITKKEMEYLTRKQRSAKAKAKRLYENYGLKNTFKVIPIKFIKTRAELNKYKQELEYFTRRSTHQYVPGGLVWSQGKDPDKYYHVPIPIHEYREARTLIKKRNRAIEKILKRMEKQPFTTHGKETGYTSTRELVEIRAGTIKEYSFKGRYIGLKPVKINPTSIRRYTVSKKSWQKFMHVIRNLQSPEALSKKRSIAHQNYMQALYNTFGKNAEPLILLINSLTDEQFIEFFESDVLQFDYIYDPNQALKALREVTDHLLRFIKRQNIQSDELLLLQAFDKTTINSGSILSEYSKGELGGRRVTFATRGKGKYKGKRIGYIDLTPEETTKFEQGYDISTIKDFESRIKWHYKG